MRTNVHPDEALSLILDIAQRNFLCPSLESIPVEVAFGRILPNSIASPIDHPPFDKSAMDGFAFSRLATMEGSAAAENAAAAGSAAATGIYRVIGSVSAGRSSDVTLEPGEAIRIMTGAPVPNGADAVQRVEWTLDAGHGADGFSLVKFSRPETIDNIIRKGENLAAGAELLSPRVLSAQDIGILAAGGFGDVTVSVKPRVAVISTGDEIETPGTSLSAASIYDSNGPQLCAQATAAGASVKYYGIVRDMHDALLAVFSRALDENDLVLISGGVSMGDFDLVPAVLAALGVETVFHSLAMRPGKPTFFGTRGAKAVFGLPGNPVSTFVNFEILAKPYLFRAMGLDYNPRIIAARLGAPLSRKGTDRVEFLPARLSVSREGMVATPLGYKGSSMINVLAETDVLLRMELGQSRIEKGETVYARRIRA